ncbi:MAG: 4-phosphoerythronate dehydrogenase PdxB [Bacteroidota bacterium]
MFPYIIADDKIPFLKGALEPFAKIHYLPAEEITHDTISTADALLIRTRTQCNKKLLHETPVQFIGTATIGFDHIDTHYCDSRKIRWVNAPGCNASSVQQYIASALFTLARREGFHLKGKTLGIVGVGHVGSKVEQLARILGMEVLLNDPPRERHEGTGKFVTLSALLEGSDIITLHVPLNLIGEDKTFHLIGAESIRKMKSGTWLINSSRGEVAAPETILQGLREKKMAGAVLDVWENEPHADPILLSQISIATPHIAGYSSDGKANGTAMVVEALARRFNLPLANWFPGTIPEPEDPVIIIDGKGKTPGEIAGEAVLKTYNILEDDARLRANPSGFEQQRGAYPVRREFPAYRAMVKGGRSESVELLKELGFRYPPLTPPCSQGGAGVGTIKTHHLK